MSDRERWTVYPLLFLALGVSLRGNFSPTHRIRCHNLSIHRPDGMLQMELTSAPPEAAGGASFRMFSEDGKLGVAMRAVPHGGLIEVAGPNGQPQVILEPTPAGGALVANSADLRAQTALHASGATRTTIARNGRGQRVEIPWPFLFHPPVPAQQENASQSPPGNTPGEAAKNQAGQNQERPASAPEQAPADNPPAAEKDKPAAEKPDPARDEQPTSSAPADEPQERPTQPNSRAR